MKNVFVYCEIEGGVVADVSLELLSKGRKLANELSCKLEAVAIGSNLAEIGKQIAPFGVDYLHVADDERLALYATLPHCAIVVKLFKEAKPQIVLVGASAIGRDLAPRIASSLVCGLTADCTSLEIGDYEDRKSKKEYKNLLYQIRPAFGGNIIATIINPDMHPQMATVREGVMKKDIVDDNYNCEVCQLAVNDYVSDTDFVIEIIERHLEKKKINIKNAPIIVAGGYGVGTKQNAALLFELANAIGGDVGASRAAVDADLFEHDRQIGQTGVTVRPKLYIACGISGAVQHRAGMDESAMIISINNDVKAPINAIADYIIEGDIAEVLPKMIKYYKKNSK